MEAQVVWKGKMSFEGSADTGFKLPLDASPAVGGDDGGFRPMELLLVGLASCTAMDVISILKKKRQDITAFEVKVHGDRASDHPKVFTDITLEYIVSGRNIDPQAVERSVELSETRYCSATAMLIKAVTIKSKITVHEVEAQ